MAPKTFRGGVRKPYQKAARPSSRVLKVPIGSFQSSSAKSYRSPANTNYSRQTASAATAPNARYKRTTARKSASEIGPLPIEVSSVCWLDNRRPEEAKENTQKASVHIGMASWMPSFRSDRSAKVHRSSMSASMTREAISVVTENLRRSRVDAAAYIKSYFDDRHGKSWICAVGTAFDIALSHDKDLFISIIIENTGVTLWRMGGQSSE